MPTSGEALPLVTVIIPVYNCEDFLRRCLDSVFDQTMQDFEVIAVNDGSTDSSLDILCEYEAAHRNLRVIDQANAGQGAARNRAIDLARGEYILFVDSDDFIERVTLQVTTERAEEDQSDMVHFDWKLYAPDRPGQSHYYNADPFWHKRVLEGIECDELLRVQNFYSVSNLYRRSFLLEHGIKFEEGRIYEDNPFVVHAVNRAQLVSMVHSPLYTINPHPESTTRSNTKTDKHYRDHIYAIRRSFELLDKRNHRSVTYLAAYHIKKMGPYYQSRIPRKYRRAYIREFVDILYEVGIEIPPATSANKPTVLSVKLGVFEKRRYTLFQSIIVGKNVVMPRYKKAKAKLRKLKHRNDKSSAWSAELENALARPITQGTIAFLGLDFKYAGNSRYLFEELIADPQFADADIKFVTTDTRVEPRYRLQPNLLSTNVTLATSQVVIAESWIPPSVRKHKDSTWIQLWHGTPLKRMLFDSHEPRIIWNRRHHKTNKFRDIQNWDYLLVDSPIAADKFETAFLFPRERMIHAQYPRVEFLLRERENKELKLSIRRTVGISDGDPRKIILYAPTWRDHNYGRNLDLQDFDYSINLAVFSQMLHNNWIVLVHDHSYLSSIASGSADNVIDASNIEIQELLLACDVVVSDYSSLIFDAFALKTPVVLHTKDQKTFEENRGLYSDIWKKLPVDIVTTDVAVVECIERTHKSRFHDQIDASLPQVVLTELMRDILNGKRK